MIKENSIQCIETPISNFNNNIYNNGFFFIDIKNLFNF